MNDIPEAVTAALAEIYPSEQPQYFRLTGSDSAPGVRLIAYFREDPDAHWHLITAGLSSRVELTARIADDASDTPPVWALTAFTQLARYVETTGITFEPGQVLNLGPALAPFSAHLRGLWFVADPELGSDEDVSFVQAVGVTADELRAITTGHSHLVGTHLLERSPVYLTEIDRDGVVSYPSA